MLKTLLTLHYDSHETALVDGNISVNFSSILEQVRNDPYTDEIICGSEPDKIIVITIVDTESVLIEWENLSHEDKAYVIDEAIYLDVEDMVENGTIDYGDIRTAMIFGA